MTKRAGRGATEGACWLALLIAAAMTLGGCSDTRPGRAELTMENIDASLPRLDVIVTDAMVATGVPGVAVSVVFDDEVVYTMGYGVRNTETGQPVEPETVFQIASLSKPVAATIIAGVVGEGTIAWDDPIATHDPDFALSDPWVLGHVTFEDLFAHRSGLPGNAGNDLESIGYDRTEILGRLRFVPLDPFRATYSYSNFGLTEGGEAAARATGTSWEDLSDTVLFGPAGMISTSMRHADFVARENHTDLHVEIDGAWTPAFERAPDAQAPAGGVSSNVIDLSRWLRLVLNGGTLDGEPIIQTDALDRTLTPMMMKRPPQPTIGDPASFYGLGWNIETDATGVVRWNHSGAFSVGASTTVTLLPAAHLGIVVLTNGEPIGVPEAIADAYLELVKTGSITQDWVAVWRERTSAIYGPTQDWSTPPAEAMPARPDEVYVGTYTNDYVGDIEVEALDSGFAIVMGPARRKFPLEHWNGDEFTYIHDPELPEYRSTVTFTIGPDGVARKVNISTFESVGFVTLARRTPNTREAVP